MLENLVWIRREMRLEDNRIFFEALKNSASRATLVVFIFDTTILKRFKNPDDKRLSFIADSLILMNDELKKHGSSILILHGDPTKLIPEICKKYNIKRVFAGEDFEPDTIKRDAIVKDKINADFIQVIDHLIISPRLVLKPDKTPYTVFIPYSKTWIKTISAGNYKDYTVNFKNALFDADQIKDIESIACKNSKAMLEKIGYNYNPSKEFIPQNAKETLSIFIHERIENYKEARDYFAINGTSAISPYLRFGLISIRECYRQAKDRTNSSCWINELIWREFYTSILFHFPESANMEFKKEYRGNLEWNQNQNLLNKFKEGKTGFPIVDASIRQLLKTGWMHNRGRMLVASFLTKFLLIDWREGESFFAEHLMDYELASNVGGWQWSSSTGTDAQPYFRIFNPFTQSKKFDPDGKFIKLYIDELNKLDPSMVHEPHNYLKFKDSKNYPLPIINYETARIKAIEFYKIRK